MLKAKSEFKFSGSHDGPPSENRIQGKIFDTLQRRTRRVLEGQMIEQVRQLWKQHAVALAQPWNTAAVQG